MNQYYGLRASGISIVSSLNSLKCQCVVWGVYGCATELPNASILWFKRMVNNTKREQKLVDKTLPDCKHYVHSKNMRNLRGI